MPKIMDPLAKKSARRRIRSFLLWFLPCLIFSPPGLAGEAGGDAIIFLGDSNYPPYEFIEDGKPAGANVDLLKAVGEALGRPVEIRLMKWAEAQKRVREGKGHALTFMSKNEERLKLYDFTEPTFSPTFSFFVKAEIAPSFDSKDLSNKRIGVHPAGFPKAFLTENHPEAALAVMEDDWDGFGKLLRGEIDAVATTEWVGSHTLKIHDISSIRAVIPPFAAKIASIAVPKGNPDLLRQINSALQNLKQNGKLDRIIDKWSGKKVVLFEMKHIWLFIFFGVLAGAFLLLIVLLLFINHSKRRSLEEEIKKRNQAEQALRGSEATLRTLINSSIGNYMAFWDVSGDLSYANFMPSNEIAAKAKEVLATKEHLRLEEQQDEKCFDYNFNPVFSVDGVLQGAVLFARDITGRKQTEEALRESQDKYRLIMESSDVIPWEADVTTFLFTYVAPQAERILGYPVEDWYGEDFWSEHIHPDDRDVTIACCLGAIERGEDNDFEYRMIAADGQVFWLHDIVKFVPRENGPGILRGLLIDISERKEAEKERLRTQKLDSLGSLAGGIAHDINNMLLPILNLTPMVARELPEGSPERKKLDMVLQASQRIKDMASRILAFSREEEDEPSKIDIFEVYDEAVDLLRTTLPSTIKVKEDLDPNTGKVLADAKQIEAVLMNLASNAADAMGGKTGKLRIALSPVAVKDDLARKVDDLRVGNYAKLTVSDTGHGMDETTLKRIFEPLFTTKDKGRGTGLGMSMIFGTVSKNGGAINVSSEVGKGTTFDIYLPLVNGSRPSESPG